jgi:uncharacterized iron-regulated protein
MSATMPIHRIVICTALALALSSAAAADDPALLDTQAIATTDLRDLKSVIPRLSTKRVVFIGEQHNRYDHHLNELAIIKGIAAHNAPLAIGMEMFEQPDQSLLDTYIAGGIDEAGLLKGTGLDRRWHHGFGLYGPILRFARERGIPVVALSAPDALVDKVRKSGVDGLSAADRARLPEIDRSDTEYLRRLGRIYVDHPGGSGNFDRFLDVQLLWDESMAARAGDYLKANPDRRMVVIAGNGHVAYGSGIPQRLKRRLKVDQAIVVQGDALGVRPQIADYILLSDPVPIPREP